MKHVFFCTGHELKIPNIVSSKGHYLFDQNGKRYMDLESGVWCTCLGHNNEDINNCIKSQLNKLMHAGFCYSHEILETSSKALLDIADFKNGKSVFLCSGSEAVEISRQISRHLTLKSVSLTLHDSYLGAYASISDRSVNWYLFNWERCKKCPEQKKCNPGCGMLQTIPNDISEFIFEPGSSSGFVRFPPKALIKNIAGIVKENGGKIIANEVTTGIGRTGRWFGFQHYGIEPDLVAVGKGVGNGYPVSAALINESMADELALKPFHYSQSHQNDPLGASIVHSVIKHIKDNDLILNAERNGRFLYDQVQSVVDKKIVTDVRGRGLMVAVDVKNETTADSIYAALIQKGYIVGNRGTSLRIDPPLTITKSEIEEFIEALRKDVSIQT